MQVWKRAVVLLFSGCLAGCTDSRRLESLEKRVAALERQSGMSKEAAERVVTEKRARIASWHVCRDAANEKFNRNLRLNGTKHRDGSYSVGVPMLQLLEQQKQNDLADCDRQYPVQSQLGQYTTGDVANEAPEPK